METSRFIPGDKTLIQNIVEYLKAKGIFDEYRHECLADVDTKSSCQNLSQRIDGYTAKFLGNETWNPDLNKNELRNKLRRHIDESGMLAVGADHVVEQVISPKITQLFLPSIIQVVHQYIREETEKLNVKQEVATEESDKPTFESTEGKAAKAVSDPIADILAFSYSKSKQTSQSCSTAKAESVQLKNPDPSLKTDKKKDDKACLSSVKTEPVDAPSENPVSATVEVKLQSDSKELIKPKKELKLEDTDINVDSQKKLQKGDLRYEKRKSDDIKQESTDLVSSCEESISNKLSNVSVKSHNSSKIKPDPDKSKVKGKPQNLQKVSSDVKKGKTKEVSDSSMQPPEKHTKLTSKVTKTPTKDSSSPFKSGSCKTSKDDKMGETGVKSKSTDISTGKTDSPLKKSSSSKLSSCKKDGNVTKYKGNAGKDEKVKNLKSVQKGEQNILVDTSSSSEKGGKSHAQYSSSHESSQGSDQDKISFIPKVRQKHFSKHVKKDPGEKKDKEYYKKCDKKQVKSSEETFKKHKAEKTSKSSLAAEKQKEFTSHDVAKISSRSNSFGSSSSVSSSSNASKDNSSCNFDSADNSVKTPDKKKRQTSKDKGKCRSPQTFPPPPPPPSSGVFEAQSSAEISSMDDTQSSQFTEDSGSETSDISVSDSETDENELCIDSLNDSFKEAPSTLMQYHDSLDALYDIFLYSSSSSEFEGYCSSPEKNSFIGNDEESEISSVHTSDLSSFDDELSDDEDSCNEDAQEPRKRKKKLTIKEAQEFLKKKADQQLTSTNKNYLREVRVDEKESVANNIKRYSSYPSSDEESNSMCGPKRELRRERKINPKYASSEYTSIFNSKKESFITKHSSKTTNQVDNLTAEIKLDEKGRELPEQAEREKMTSKRKIQVNNSRRNENMNSQMNEPESENLELSLKESAVKLKEDSDFQLRDNQFSFGNNDSKCRFALQVKKSENKCNAQNRLDINSHPVKRKLSSSNESAPSMKRPCSRSSVDSCSSEFSVNENKPFNNEKNEIAVSTHTGVEQKIHKMHSNLKNSSNITKNLKKDLFSQQNNGDILGKVEQIKKNAQSKSHSTPEKNRGESDLNPELTAV